MHKYIPCINVQINKYLLLTIITYTYLIHIHAYTCMHNTIKDTHAHTQSHTFNNFSIITQMPLYTKIKLTSGQLAAHRWRLRRRRPGLRRVSLDRATRREGRGVRSRSPTAINGIPRRAGKWFPHKHIKHEINIHIILFSSIQIVK